MNEPIPVIRETDCGTARLLPDVDRDRAWLLTVDGAPQSYVDLDEPEHLEFEYVRRLGHVVDRAGAPGAPLDVVHLGGGALTLPRYVAATRPGSRQDVAE
ncbi:spermidine synthase-like protein, partial [Streptomyces sp. NRRL S-15]